VANGSEVGLSWPAAVFGIHVTFQQLFLYKDAAVLRRSSSRRDRPLGCGTPSGKKKITNVFSGAGLFFPPAVMQFAFRAAWLHVSGLVKR